MASAIKIRDSIMVSQLPSMLLADLKVLMLEHFANFGRILRISCATKGRGERVAHIQFSSSDEALKAKQNGDTVNGHKLIIAITDKPPSTQVLTSIPRPRSSTLASTSSGAAQNENKGHIQSTLSTYFQRASPLASAGPSRSTPTANAILEEAVTASPASTSASASTHVIDSEQHLVEKKPNTCVKLEVYQGSSRQCPQAATNATASTISVVANNSRAPARLPPARSLSEILNLDLSRMKIVKTVTASDALACQYFTGGRHPFPLAMMFGKIPGSVIMPTKSIMDSIKPGMAITDSTTELIWNTVLQSVLKKLLAQTAKTVLRESIVDKFVLEKYMKLEEDVVGEQLAHAAEREVGYEEDVMICCEDVVDAMLWLVCSSLIENASGEELRTSKAISRALECCFRKLTDTVTKEVIDEVLPHALLDSLCEEALEDVLESPIFERHVRVVAAGALRKCRDERDMLGDCTSSDSSTSFTRERVNEPPNLLDPINSWESTENWLETSRFNIYKDVQTNDVELITDISCSVGSSRSSTISHRYNNESQHSLTPDGNETERSNADDQNGFFSSLKRKLPLMFSFQNLNPFKRRRF